MNKNILFKIENINFSYRLGAVKIQAIHHLSMEIPSQSLITLTGPSGSGKSTLLNILGLIEPLQSGKIFFNGTEIGGMTNSEKNQLRKFKIGFIFQQFHLMPVLTAEENVMYFLGCQKQSKAEMMIRTKEALQLVGLWTHRKKRPGELSGGQRQRVAIARALAKKPEVIIGDEPTASLDQKTGREIMEILSEMVHEKKLSTIITTHDSMVQSYACHNFHIQDGRLLC